MNATTQNAANAFVHGERFESRNTVVSIQYAENNPRKRIAIMHLHGNRIASFDGRTINMTLAGWNTKTTRERLNGICKRLGLPTFSQKNFVPYWDNQPINAHTQIVDFVNAVYF